MVSYYHSSVLPWTALPEERKRLRRIAQIVLAVFLLSSVIVSTIHVPERDRFKARDIPPRFAKLILEQRQKPKPKPKPVVKPEKKKEEKKEKEVKKEKPKKEKPKEKKKEEPPKREVELAKARKKAQQSGLLAFADELEDLRETPKVKDVNVNLSKKGKQEDLQPEMLTMKRASSGGIDTSKLSRSTRSHELAGRSAGQIESPVAREAREGKKPRQVIKGARTLEQIQLVIERYKGALTRMHTIALRRDPSIEGQVLLKMTIAKEGTVSECKVLSADFDSPSFLRKVESKCRSFDFGPASNDMTIKYPLDFIPIS